MRRGLHILLYEFNVYLFLRGKEKNQKRLHRKPAWPYMSRTRIITAYVIPTNAFCTYTFKMKSRFPPPPLILAAAVVITYDHDRVIAVDIILSSIRLVSNVEETDNRRAGICRIRNLARASCDTWLGFDALYGGGGGGASGTGRKEVSQGHLSRQYEPV